MSFSLHTLTRFRLHTAQIRSHRHRPAFFMDKPPQAYYHYGFRGGECAFCQMPDNRQPGRLFLFALSTCPHCRATRKMLDGLKAPYDLLEVDLLAGPEQERALAELARHNPALTFPTLLAGGRVAAGPLPDDLRRLAMRFAGASTMPENPGPGADDLSREEALAGLRVNQARYGYGSCPSRLATGDADRDRPIICPCVFRDEDLAKYGRCYGRLYFSPQVPGAPVMTAVPDRWLR